MATTLNLTTKRADGKEVVKAITNVNPNISDNNAALIAVALNNLTDNELTNVEKVTKSDIEFDKE